MNATELATLSMSELKGFCTSHAIEVIGDKRSKATWISAIESFQSKQTVIEIETLPAMPDPFEDSYEFVMSSETVNQSEVPDVLSVIDNSDNTTTLQQLTNETPAPQQPAPKPHRQASIVVLIPLILLTVAVIAIRIGIGALIPLIAAVGRLLVAVWRSIPRIDNAPLVRQTLFS